METWVKLLIGGVLEFLRLRPRKARQPVEPPAPPVMPPTPVVPPTAILLVEDDADDAFLTLQTLQEAGYVCDWTESAQHALMLMEKTTYRMMIIDIGLRVGMNGWSLAKAVRREHPTMPIWLHTGSQDNLFCVEPGVPVGLLLKSINRKAVLDMIKMTA